MGLGTALWNPALARRGPGAALRLLCLCQVVPAGGSSTISISFTPVVLGPSILHKVECTGYALGFMSLDNEVSPPGLGWHQATACLLGSTLPTHPRDGQ